jgi:hypothetical protein
VGAPVNLYKLGFKIALPEVTFGIKLRKYLDLKKTDPEKAKTLISEATGDFVVGELVRFAAIAMVSNGLISAGYDDDDERTKEAIYKVSGGPNRINVTGFFRGLAGGKFENKEGDDWRDLSSMGYLGMTLAGYGHAYHGMTKEEADQFTDLTSLSAPKNIANMNLNMVLSEMKAGLDMPFLTGYNQIQDVLKSNDGSKLDKFILNSTKSLMTTMVPATHQQLSRSVTGDVYASYDKEKTLSQNVFDALGYNFFFQGGGDMKKKMNTLSETEKDVKKAKEHMLFDNTLGRMLYNLNPFGTTEVPKTSPINKLYNEIMKTPQKEREQLFPSEPKNVVNLGGKNNAKYVTLNQEQYDYYRQMASMWRMFNATPYIMSEDFDKDDTTTKTETLQKLYSKGLTAAKILLKEKYPDLKDMATEDENSSNSKERVQQYNRLD